MCPSFGSMSTPADVPHLRPAGSSPQLRVTFGAGLGRFSPVIGFATFAAPWARSAFASRVRGSEAIRTKKAQAPTVETRIRGVVMAPPRTFEGRTKRASVFLGRRRHARHRSGSLQNPALHPPAVAGLAGVHPALRVDR